MCSHINGYLTGTAPDGYAAHHTTLTAAMLGLSQADQLRGLRKEIANRDYRVQRKDIARCGARQEVQKGLYFWAPEVSKYSMLFEGADSAVVANSQGVTAALLQAQTQIQTQAHRRTFAQYAAYLSLNSYWQVLAVLGVGGVTKLLCSYEFGRKLLSAYPSVMTLGAFSEEGPSAQQRRSQTWSLKFVSKGYSRQLCAQYKEAPHRLAQLKPAFSVRARVSGSDAGYSGTAKMLIECAVTLLQDNRRIRRGDLDQGIPWVRGGVFTPSTVFANTELVSRLKEAGIAFQIEQDDENEDDKQDDDENDADDDEDAS